MFGTGQITTTRLFPRSTQVIEVYDLERRDDSSCNPEVCTCLFPLSTRVIQVYDLERRDDSSCNPEVCRYTRAKQERGTSYNFEVSG